MLADFEPFKPQYLFSGAGRDRNDSYSWHASDSPFGKTNSLSRLDTGALVADEKADGSGRSTPELPRADSTDAAALFHSDVVLRLDDGPARA